MDIFDQYEQEFSRKTNTIRQKISSLQRAQGERKKTAVQEIERLIDDAKQTLRNMEEYASNNDAKDRSRRLQSRTRGLSQELTKLQRDLQTASLDTFARRDEYGYGEDDLESRKMEQRMRLLTSNERLGETSERLASAERIGIETESIGVSVLGELSSQRQQLERTKENLGLVDDNITRSRKILSSMSRRIATNKLILAFIIVILVAAICLIVYFKWVQPLIKKM